MPFGSALAAYAEELLDHVVRHADDLRARLESALDQDQLAERLGEIDVGGLETPRQDLADALVLGGHELALGKAGIVEQAAAALVERLRIAEVGDGDRAELLLLLVR